MVYIRFSVLSIYSHPIKRGIDLKKSGNGDQLLSSQNLLRCINHSPQKNKKMALDNETIHSIARLARLKIEDSEIDQYRSSLGNILDLVAQMEAVDTTGIEPMTHPFDATMRLRKDQVTETNQRDKYQGIAPSTERGLYLVPKVID